MPPLEAYQRVFLLTQCVTLQMNFDTSEVVIDQCKERNESRPNMEV